MGLNDTPLGERLHIGFFGCTNAGKSSLVNAVTGQNLSVVSDTHGTTTDPVQKAMELLPLGPVVIIDTPGYNDTGELGKQRVEATKRILRKCDIAVLVTDVSTPQNKIEDELISLFEKREIPYIIAKNKSDLLTQVPKNTQNIIYTSTQNNTGIELLKEAIGKSKKTAALSQKLIGDLIKKQDFVLLVTPIDKSAPKGRLILPQQQIIRGILDVGAISVVIQQDELEYTLKSFKKTPALVVTDSQIFSEVSAKVPNEIPLTSFSILMARYKNFLTTSVKGVKTLDSLPENAKILISEGCTHHRQCEDIGTVKLPSWLNSYTTKNLEFSFSSGASFPDDLSRFSLIIHCGGCMLNEKEMIYRMEQAKAEHIPFTNYGIAIAHINGILKRSISMLPEAADILQ